MKSVVDNHAVEQHLVLNRRTAADVKLSALVTCADKSGQDLQGLDQIRLPPKTRNPLQIRRPNRLDRHVDLRLLLLTFRADFCRTQLDHFRIKQVVAGEDFPVLQNHLFPDPFVLEAGDDEGVGAHRNLAQTVETIQICRAPESRALQCHRSKHHRLSRGRIFQKSLDGALGGNSGNPNPKHREQCRNAVHFLHDVRENTAEPHIKVIFLMRFESPSDVSRSRRRSTTIGNARGVGRGGWVMTSFEPAIRSRAARKRVNSNWSTKSSS